MKLPTWPLAAAALGGLLLLVAVSVLTLSRKAQDIYTELDQVNTHHLDVDTRLRKLRADLQLSGVYIRDYLLDNAREHMPEYRRHLQELRANNVDSVEKLRAIVRADDRARVAGLEGNLNDYWQTFDPLFDWTPVEKIVNSARFLKQEVLPRREAVLAIAHEIEQLNNSALVAQRADVLERQEQFRRALHSLLWQSLALGLVVALTAVARLRAVERRSDVQRNRAEAAESQMRHLSQQLVATQEEERRKLSRELHDHVGQMLTALRLEVGGLERLRLTAPDGRFAQAVAECKSLVDTVMRTVRDLALGLRPSMLDDLGLQPALEWHVRDFRRRYDVRVTLNVAGDLSNLPDHVRTCAYRVVQEALTNCVRHARATQVDVSVTLASSRLEVSVVDNGVGFDMRQRPQGLGLVGIEERVRELHGACTVQSAPGDGTRVTVTVPVSPDVAEVHVARVAS